MNNLPSLEKKSSTSSSPLQAHDLEKRTFHFFVDKLNSSFTKFNETLIDCDSHFSNFCFDFPLFTTFQQKQNLSASISAPSSPVPQMKSSSPTKSHFNSDRESSNLFDFELFLEKFYEYFLKSEPQSGPVWTIEQQKQQLHAEKTESALLPTKEEFDMIMHKCGDELRKINDFAPHLPFSQITENWFVQTFTQNKVDNPLAAKARNTLFSTVTPLITSKSQGDMRKNYDLFREEMKEKIGNLQHQIQLEPQITLKELKENLEKFFVASNSLTVPNSLQNQAGGPQSLSTESDVSEIGTSSSISSPKTAEISSTASESKVKSLAVSKEKKKPLKVHDLNKKVTPVSQNQNIIRRRYFAATKNLPILLQRCHELNRQRVVLFQMQNLKKQFSIVKAFKDSFHEIAQQAQNLSSDTPPETMDKKEEVPLSAEPFTFENFQKNYSDFKKLFNSDLYDPLMKSFLPQLLAVVRTQKRFFSSSISIERLCTFGYHLETWVQFVNLSQKFSSKSFSIGFLLGFFAKDPEIKNFLLGISNRLKNFSTEKSKLKWEQILRNYKCFDIFLRILVFGFDPQRKIFPLKRTAKYGNDIREYFFFKFLSNPDTYIRINKFSYLNERKWLELFQSPESLKKSQIPKNFNVDIRKKGKKGYHPVAAMSPVSNSSSTITSVASLKTLGGFDYEKFWPDNFRSRDEFEGKTMCETQANIVDKLNLADKYLETSIMKLKSAKTTLSDIDTLVYFWISNISFINSAWTLPWKAIGEFAKRVEQAPGFLKKTGSEILANVQSGVASVSSAPKLKDDKEKEQKTEKEKEQKTEKDKSEKSEKEQKSEKGKEQKEQKSEKGKEQKTEKDKSEKSEKSEKLKK